MVQKHTAKSTDSVSYAAHRVFEDHVDGLMDDLFTDVEKALAIKVTESSSTTYKDLDPDLDRRLESNVVSIVKIDAYESPSVTKAAPPDPSDLWIQAYVEPSAFNSEATINSNQSTATPPRAKSTVAIDSLLLGAACTSIIFTGIVWFANSRVSSYAMRSPDPIEVAPEVSDETARFAEEMRLSLLNFANKNTTEPSITKSSNPTESKSESKPNQPIYVPVYQPPVVIAPKVSTPSPTPIAPTSTAVNSSPLVKVAPKGSYTLIGILELGDRSSAMFDVNGSVQSVKTGGVVGDSGWSIFRINQQDVILKRGNENTSVTVGQKF